MADSKCESFFAQLFLFNESGIIKGPHVIISKCSKNLLKIVETSAIVN